MKWSSAAPLVFPLLIAIFLSFLELKKASFNPKVIPAILLIWVAIGAILGSIYWWYKRDKSAFNLHHDTVNALLQTVAERNHLEFDKFRDVNLAWNQVVRGQGSTAGDISGHYVSIGLDLPSVTDSESTLSSVSMAKKLDMIFAIMFQEPLTLFQEKVSLRKKPIQYEDFERTFSKCFKGKNLETIPTPIKKALLDFASEAKSLQITKSKIRAVPKETQLMSVPEIENFLNQLLQLTMFIEDNIDGFKHPS